MAFVITFRQGMNIGLSWIQGQGIVPKEAIIYIVCKTQNPADHSGAQLRNVLCQHKVSDGREPGFPVFLC
jgi:hypothetical protein